LCSFPGDPSGFREAEQATLFGRCRKVVSRIGHVKTLVGHPSARIADRSAMTEVFRSRFAHSPLTATVMLLSGSSLASLNRMNPLLEFRSRFSLAYLEVDIDGKTTTPKLIGRALAGHQIRVSPASGIGTADMVEQSPERIGDVLEFRFREVLPLVEMHGLVDRPLLGICLIDQALRIRKHLFEFGLLRIMTPMPCGLYALLEPVAPATCNRRQEIANVITCITLIFGLDTEIICQNSSDVLEIAPQQASGVRHIVDVKRRINFCPDIGIIPNSWTGINTPAAKVLGSGSI